MNFCIFSFLFNHTAVSYFRRQCYIAGERQLKFFKIYTKSNCELECLTNLTLRYCNCSAFFMPSKTICITLILAKLSLEIFKEEKTPRFVNFTGITSVWNMRPKLHRMNVKSISIVIWDLLIIQVDATVCHHAMKLLTIMNFMTVISHRILDLV
jgi:hypothetical protein